MRADKQSNDIYELVLFKNLVFQYNFIHCTQGSFQHVLFLYSQKQKKEIP